MSARHPRPRRFVAIGALGLTAVLGACGSAGGSGAASRDAGGQSAGTPLEQLFGDSSTIQRATEDEIARCMRARGWEYTPNTSGVGTVIGSDPMGDATFRAQYGYGISTQPPPEAFGIASGADASKDPNMAFLERLSEREREQYQKDLFGPMVPESGSSANGGAVQIAGPDSSSCMGQATAAVAKKHPEMSEEFFERLSELMRDMEDDPAMKAAMKAWSTCMAKGSFTYATIDDLMTDLSQRAQAILGTGDTGGIGVAAPVGAIGIGAASGAAPTTTLNASDQSRLDALQREERALAQADYACRETTVDPVRPKLEQKVVDKLRSEFPGIGGGR